MDSVLALFEILIDKNETAQNRLEAAEQILAYEAPPQAVAEAKSYLTEVFNNRSDAASLRLQAIKLMRKSEARKAKPPHPMTGLARSLEAARARLRQV
jgi:hypothetical protein